MDFVSVKLFCMIVGTFDDARALNAAYTEIGVCPDDRGGWHYFLTVRAADGREGVSGLTGPYPTAEAAEAAARIAYPATGVVAPAPMTRH